MKFANFIAYIPDRQKYNLSGRCTLTMRKDSPLAAMWFMICIGALIVGIWIDWGPS